MQKLCTQGEVSQKSEQDQAVARAIVDVKCVCVCVKYCIHKTAVIQNGNSCTQVIDLFHGVRGENDATLRTLETRQQLPQLFLREWIQSCAEKK
jgi:hypothetical protein